MLIRTTKLSRIKVKSQPQRQPRTSCFLRSPELPSFGWVPGETVDEGCKSEAKNFDEINSLNIANFPNCLYNCLAVGTSILSFGLKVLSSWLFANSSVKRRFAGQPLSKTKKKMMILTMTRRRMHGNSGNR